MHDVLQVSPQQTTSETRRPYSRRSFLKGSMAVGAAGAGLALYSGEIARHLVQTTHRSFALRNLPAAFDGFRIVQISDLHLGEFTEDPFLRHVVEKVNQIGPDLVLITGDFVSRGPWPLAHSLAAARRCGEILNGLACPLRYGSLGNHDAFVGSRDVRTRLENNGIPILQNEFLRIEHGGEHLWLGGTDDILTGAPNLELAVPPRPDAPVILMAHEPDYADKVYTHPRGRNVDLMLSGHTHGGQVRLPGMKPLALPPIGRRYVEGHFLIGDLQLYVNRGIGTTGVPFRLNCPPEILVATLRPA